MRARLITFFALFWLWGCAAGPSAFYHGPTPKDGEPAGYAIVSVSRDREIKLMTDLALIFRDPSTEDEGRFRIYIPDLSKDTFDVRNEKYEGFVTILRLPPGKYEIYNFEVSIASPLGSTRFSSREDFSIPFEVQSGRAVYIGSYDSTPTYGKSIFGVDVVAGTYWILSDRHERDLAVAKAREPALGQMAIDLAVPDPRRLNIPLIAAEPLR